MKRFLLPGYLSCFSLFSFLLAGCGFHSLHLDQLPYKKIYINAPYSSAGEDLRRYISRYTQVVDDPSQAEVILTLVRSGDQRSTGDTINPFISSVKPFYTTGSSPSGAVPSPFAPLSPAIPTTASNASGLASVGYAANVVLTSILEYKLERPSGEVLIAPTTLSESRSINNDESRVLAKYRESDDNLKILRHTLFQNMIRQMNRIYLNRQQASAPPTITAPTMSPESDKNP